MKSATDWKTIRERLESLLPHGRDETPWNVLQQHSFALVANELLWRVEAIAEQVPPQGPIFLRSLARTEHAPAGGECELYREQPGSGRGRRCTLCVTALCLILGFPLPLPDAGLVQREEVPLSQQQDEPGVISLFES